jgi:hypothetical protein
MVVVGEKVLFVLIHWHTCFHLCENVICTLVQDKNGLQQYIHL